MKKSLVLLLMCCLFIPIMKAQETGFGTTGDVMVGYKDKIVSTTLGYDLGYKFIPNLYIGAGPMVSGSFGNGGSEFSVGGYGKIRYVIPLSSTVKPFVDGRVGYAYNLTSSAGDMIYGFGLGIHFSERFNIGVYCHVGNTIEMEEYTYYKTYTTPGGHKGRIPITGTREKNKATFTPALMFSVDF